MISGLRTSQRVTEKEADAESREAGRKVLQSRTYIRGEESVTLSEDAANLDHSTDCGAVGVPGTPVTRYVLPNANGRVVENVPRAAKYLLSILLKACFAR
jgi:hypothetical protein